MFARRFSSLVVVLVCLALGAFGRPQAQNDRRGDHGRRCRSPRAIEKGKLANLVVTDGNLFDENTKITRVFIEGRSVSLEAPAAAGAGRGGR